MKFILEINLGNDAMCDSDHIALALKEASNKIEQLPIETVAGGATIKDINGTTVGHWMIKEDE